MADKQSRVRLQIDGGGFTSELNKLKGDAARSGQQMGTSLGQGLTNGLKGGLGVLQSGLDRVKGAILDFGGILGGVGIAELGRRSIETSANFRSLATAVEFGSGRVMDWTELQRDAQAAASRWSQTSADLGDTMQTVFSETGDIDFTRASIDTIATTARATKAPLEELGRVSGILQNKFGITADELPEALTTVISAANRGGMSLENLADDFGEIGGKAKTMGLTGQEGIEKMLGMLSVARAETGRFEQAMTALPQIFDAIIEEGGSKDGKLFKMKVATVDKDGKQRDPIDILKDVIAKTGGDETKLGELGFGGEGLQTVLALAREFQSELDRTGGNIEAGKKAIDKALQDAGRSAVSFTEVQSKAASELEQSDAKFQAALEKLERAFASEGVANAIDKLAEILPPLAEGLVKVLEWATKNPYTMGALGAGSFLPQGGGGAVGGALGAIGGGGGAAAAAGGAKGGLNSIGFGPSALLAMLGMGSALDQASTLGSELATYESEEEGMKADLVRNAIRSGTIAYKQRNSIFDSGGIDESQTILAPGKDGGVDELEDNATNRAVALARTMLAKQRLESRQATEARREELNQGLPSFVTGGSGPTNSDAIAAPITASVDRVADSLNRTLTVHIPGTVNVRNQDPPAPSSGIDARSRR